MEKQYATVIGRLIAKGENEDAVMKNLMAHLTETGRVKLLPAILRELKVIFARRKTLGATVEAHARAAPRSCRY